MRFDAWDFRDVQSAFSILRKMEKHGVETIADATFFLKKYLVDLVNEEKAKRIKAIRGTRLRIPERVCKKCGSPVFLEPVNVSRCTRTGDRSKTAIVCYDEKGCGHIDYSKVPHERFPLKWVTASTDRDGKVVFVDEE